jgi:hypothetical protein
MPSRADIRVTLENVARGLVIGALAILLRQTLDSPSSASDRHQSGQGAGSLAQWSKLPRAPETIHVELSAAPTPVDRDWLRALAAAGSRVTWSGNLPATMIATSPVASPAGGTRVRVAAPDESNVVVSDDVGVVDTIRVQNSGASVVLPSASKAASARVGQSLASVSRRDSARLGKVLVIGDAGWESKFVVAALEEDGWKVDAFIRVSPDVDVTQGSIAAIDTARYSAVIALDGAAAPYAGRIAEFVRSGGGLVLTPGGASIDAMSTLRAGAPTRAATASAAVQAAGSVTLASVPFAPISSQRGDAITLEKRGANNAIAARRVIAGRVLQIGYEDTWRWRMGGAANAVREHRSWWTGLVSRVAYAPRTSSFVETAAEQSAPLAALVSAIGPPVSGEAVADTGRNQSHWLGWLFGLMSLALIGEIASRRLRGAR